MSLMQHFMHLSGRHDDQLYFHSQQLCSTARQSCWSLHGWSHTGEPLASRNPCTTGNTHSYAQFIDALKADRRLGAALQSPSVSYGSTNLFMRGVLEEATSVNLSRPLSELVDGSGSIVQAREP